MAAAREKQNTRSRLGWSPNGGFTGQWMVVPALAGAALVILMAFVLAAGAGIYFAGPRGAQAADLSSASGLIEVLDTEGTGGWTTVSDGYRVTSGQRIRTGSDSQVTLTFFEGTQVTLEPNTDLMLSKVDGNWGRELQVALIQNEGMTNHQVIPLQGSASTYNIMTPSGDASVRGTSFKVLVEETGDSVFSVDTGAVMVSNNGDEAILAAGQGVLTELGKPLAATSFLFALQGTLEDNTGKTWQVAGVSFTVKGGTRVDAGLEQGDSVLVSGRITHKNEWIADSVLAYDSESPGGTFTGIVTSLEEGLIGVDGRQLSLPEGQDEVYPGDLVRVQFTIQEGVWVVDKLEVLRGGETSEPDTEPAPDTQEPEESETELYFASEEDKIATCGAADPFTNTLYYVSSDEQAQPLEVSLVAMVEEDPEGLVSEVVIEPAGAFTIDPSLPENAEDTAVAFNVTVVLAGEIPPQSEIEVKIELRYGLDGDFTGDVYKIKLECEEDLPDEEEDDADDDGDKCNRDGDHPHARTLYEEYGERVDVTYDDIWDWFCEDNLGFGEIELAFKLFVEYGEAAGYSVHDIIDERLEEGLGWGQIKQELKQAESKLLLEEESQKKVPPGKEKSEEAKNKDKPNKKDD
jgi:hypothetical protein